MIKSQNNSWILDMFPIDITEATALSVTEKWEQKIEVKK